jgi:hypothetical protein
MPRNSDGFGAYKYGSCALAAKNASPPIEPSRGAKRRMPGGTRQSFVWHVPDSPNAKMPVWVDVNRLDKKPP